MSVTMKKQNLKTTFLLFMFICIVNTKRWPLPPVELSAHATGREYKYGGVEERSSSINIEAEWY